MAWFRVANKRLQYRGLTHGPFAAWLATQSGAEATDAAADGIRFALLGRRRAARRRLWRHLRSTVSAQPVQSVIRDHARVYQSLLATLAFVEPLPRMTVDLRRVVIVPRLLLNAAAYESLRGRLSAVVDTGTIPGGEALREFLVTTLVDEMDRAFVTGRPRLSRPLPSNEEWASVGVDLHFTWETPEWAGPTWPGHHFVYERPRGGLTRRQRRRLQAALGQVDQTIARWPPFKRHETMQRAQRAALAVGAITH